MHPQPGTLQNWRMSWADARAEREHKRKTSGSVFQYRVLPYGSQIRLFCLLSCNPEANNVICETLKRNHDSC